MTHIEEDLAIGEELFRTGRLDEAREFFEQLVQTDPQHYEAMNNLGTIFYQQGDITAAERYFHKAFSVKTDDSDILLNLADLYYNQKKWTDASLFLERYLRLHPEDCESLNKLACIFMELGENSHAIKALEKSLAIDETQEDIRNIIKTFRAPVSEPSLPINRQMAPLISVGLPVYNGGKLLPQAIESILSQDFSNFELIISDNGSTDETQEVCLYYNQRDRRIKYFRFDENHGMLTNFLNVLGHADAPYFMFATHDDLREKTLISSCLPFIEKDKSVALVYPRSKVVDANSNFIGFGEDRLTASQESPQERFKHVIWEFTMGNSILGIFRLSIIKKITSWGKALYGDNLVMAEVALLGKIIQIDAPLFIRRLTRNYNYRTHDERNAQLIAEGDPRLFSEGISFPHSRLAYAHLELLNQSNMEKTDKEMLMNEVIKCFRTRFGSKMMYEIDRAISLINDGYFYHQWNQSDHMKECFSEAKVLGSFHISGLLKRLQEARFFFPEREDLDAVHMKCLNELNYTHSLTS
jgi:glycosyltransferase involved in cell wall biosynthesis